MYSSVLKGLIRDKSLSVLDVASRIGIPVEQMAAYISGDSVPNGLILVKLGDFFGVSIDYIMGRTTTKGMFDSADVMYRKGVRASCYDKSFAEIVGCIKRLSAELKRIDNAMGGKDEDKERDSAR